MTPLEGEYGLYNAILQPYLGEPLEIGRLYNSPLPDHRDSSASFQVYKGFNSEDKETDFDFTQMLFWKDWGYGKHLGHRPAHLLQHLNPGMTLGEAIKKLKSATFETKGVQIRVATKKLLNHISSFAYTERELEYWNKYHIDPYTLIKYNVMGTRFITKEGEQVYDSTKGPTTFTYVGPEDKFQLYRPKPKWIRRSVGSTFLLGYEQLPYRGRILLILSGMKDGLCCHKATGWPFVSGSGENDYHTFQPFMEELRERFDYIGVCQDPDKAGVDANILLAEKLGIPIFDFPYPNDEWDIAELMENYGPAQLRNAFYLKTPFKK